MKLRSRINIILFPTIVLVFVAMSVAYYHSAKRTIVTSKLTELAFQMDRVNIQNVQAVNDIEQMLKRHLDSREAIKLFDKDAEPNKYVEYKARFINRFIDDWQTKEIQDISIFDVNLNTEVYINFDDPFAEAEIQPKTKAIIENISALIAEQSHTQVLAHNYTIEPIGENNHQFQVLRVFSPYLLMHDQNYHANADLHIIQVRMRSNHFADSFYNALDNFGGYLHLDISPKEICHKISTEPLEYQLINNKNAYNFVVNTDMAQITVKLDKAYFEPALHELTLQIVAGVFALTLSCFALLNWMINQHIIKPITNLAKAVNETESSEKFTLEPSKKNDEVSELNNSYVALIERINILANNDPLTGLANRSRFNNLFEKIILHPTTPETLVGLLFIDLDNFKSVNDNFGHEAGDNVLKTFADELTRIVEKNIGTERQGKRNKIARLGGDEFIVLVEGIHALNCLTTIAKDIINLFKDGLNVNENIYDVHASIGIHYEETKNIEIDTFIQQADTAMYSAKHQGKNNYQVYSDELDAQFKESSYIESAIKQALREQSFFLVFMPTYNTQTEVIKGFEVLLRAPALMEQGIGPDKFIPVAEKSELITEIDLWVIEEAFSKLNVMRIINKFNGTLAINISSRELNNELFVGRVQELLVRYAIPPHLIEFEITETCLSPDDRMAVDSLSALKALGVQIALDDFGTGYTAFNQLNTYPLDTLKIDRSFISQVNETLENKRPAIDIIYELANIYNLNVVVEGIETFDQLQYVKSLGCDMVQGYFLSKPLEWKNAIKLLESDMHSSVLKAV